MRDIPRLAVPRIFIVELATPSGVISSVAQAQPARGDELRDPLVADYATIEYGPVHFKARNLDMWLPQNAEVHYDWRGRRSHRRHSFKNYLLFSVDEKQQISEPKDAGQL